ncbi:hypothetical protein CYMTET_31220 [Cymbomonas tetramitiformis]|uniref:UTP--glucose-1-phosphate uridylyltransferase n=1 Tax=Cymbomonas tetramitiformis TaxID=36881 RepID=A0AAE0KT47_9CHLO|nr:hypothetical protein CYMTET_31220 [Cymbomonas tetramitiformis]
MSLDIFKTKMSADAASQAAIKAFQRNYEALVSGANLDIREQDITPVDALPSLADIKETHRLAKHPQAKEILAATAVLKLNGGLGTSMGLERAKSLLPVKHGITFLDLIAKQIKYLREEVKLEVPFTLMNSYNTSDDTKSYLSVKNGELLEEPHFELMQNKTPKVDAATLAPASYPANPALEWCPPGHGDFYPSLIGTGMMERLLSDGVKYLFVSNGDNLGADLEKDLLCYFATNNIPFLMECTERVAADKKGGHVARNKEGHLVLREVAQCSPEDEMDFMDIKRHKFFNTNNLWINLEALKSLLEENDGVMPLPPIKNRKTVNPRDKTSTPVFQLETTVGAAIQCFPGARAVVVPRTRFAPVKTCSDLFMLQSNAYRITDDAKVVLKSKQVPLVKLDDDHYKMADQMLNLVQCVPVLEHCKALTVRGAVKFLPGVVIMGKVAITNTQKDAKELPPEVYQNIDVML